ncbi:MAG: GAF domain-containing protein [Thermoanaerobaculia bacterium]|nr:GAF domain-containing protein [Thermoanaerobaculia bacterium]
MNQDDNPLDRESARKTDGLRHAKQESALVQIGSLALANASLGFLFSQVTSLVGEMLGADDCELWKCESDDALLVATSGNQDAVGELRAGQTSQEQYTVATGQPVAVTDLASETRFRPSRHRLDDGIASSLSIPIAGGEMGPWGVVAVHSRARRAFPTSDVNFLRAVAVMLSQIIERRHVEVELRVRASQQSAIAALGRIAASGSAQTMLDRACELAMDGLSVEYASFLRLSPNGQTLERVAGPRPVHDMAIDVSSSHAGLALTTGEAVRVDDFLRDPLFVSSPHYVPYSIRSGIALPVIAGGHTFGVLAAETRVEKRFTAGDSEFMESLATLLGEALERERSRRALIESERRYRSVVEGASEIIFSISPGGEIISLNPAFQVITGWPAADWLGKSLVGLVVPEDQGKVTSLLTSMLRQPQSMTREAKLVGRHGPVLLEVSVSPRVAEGRVVELYGFARDISEQRRAEAEKDQVTAKLEQANRLSSLGRLAATVAHEFNNVLMGIAPFADILRRETLSERGLSAVEQIASSVKRGKRITEDILRFTQPAEPVFNALEIETWLPGIVTEARSILGPNYAIDLDLGDSDFVILGDPNQLHQSFVNLMLNARDAMLDGGRITVSAVREEPEARFPFGAVRHPERFAHIILEDRGHGMSRETLRHIFEPLFTTKRNGTGLGLAVTRQVITKHAGEIFVESAEGVGTRFHLFLPLSHEVILAAGSPETARLPGPRRYARVLIVEDERAVSSGLASLLESEGVAVQVVESGGEVMGAVARNNPDVVVLDIGLPDMDGTIVYASLSAAYPRLPVVFSSGHGDQVKLEHLLTQPHVSFLLKPYDIDTLLRTLDRVTAA